MQLDYKTLDNSGLFNGSAENKKRTFFRKKSAMQGAVRLSYSPSKKSTKGIAVRRVITVAAFFLFSALIATVGNGNVVRQSELNPLKLIGNYPEQQSSSTDPDFYFIESNQFVPGSARLKLAAYKHDGGDNEILVPTGPEPVPQSAANSANQIEQPDDPIENSADFTDSAEPNSNGQFFVEDVRVKSGDTLSELLVDHGVDTGELHRLLTNDYVKKHLSMLRIDQELSFRRYADGRLASFSMNMGQERKLVVSRGDDNFVGSIIEMPLRRLPQAANAVIESSLFLAGQSAGLSQKTIMNLVDVFQWDVDFSIDIRKGDRFKIIYEKLYRDGEYLGEGDILAAEFQNGNRIIKAIRYTDFTGRTSYYTPEGRSMRKAFLRNPVDVVRITSHFNPNRKHPVLHTIRAHKGTDYGAPIGTPIRSTGDGKVLYAGNKGGYGKTVIIKHGDKYTTLYAHMSKIAKSTRSGKRIKQGQIIGYVGKTGRVTGAHLHYEFRINGVHKNPLKVKFPGARPIPKKYKADFLNKSRDLLARLQNLDTTTIAMETH